MNCEKVLKQNFETEKAQYCRNIDPYRVESMYIFLSFIEMNVLKRTIVMYVHQIIFHNPKETR